MFLFLISVNEKLFEVDKIVITFRQCLIYFLFLNVFLELFWCIDLDWIFTILVKSFQGIGRMVQLLSVYGFWDKQLGFAAYFFLLPIFAAFCIFQI